MTHNRLREFLQTQFHNFLTFTYKATQILHKYSNKCGKKSIVNLLPWLIYSKEKNFYKQRTKKIHDSFAFRQRRRRYLYPPLPAPSPVEEEAVVG